jgi:hypothetical protein
MRPNFIYLVLSEDSVLSQALALGHLGGGLYA